MSIRIGVTKQISAGEQIVFDVLQCNSITGEKEYGSVGEMLKVVDETLADLDVRAGEMVKRILGTSQLRMYCTPEEWNKISAVLDIVSGRCTSDEVVWRWQQVKEENEALEQGRLDYANFTPAEQFKSVGDGSFVKEGLEDSEDSVSSNVWLD